MLAIIVIVLNGVISYLFSVHMYTYQQEFICHYSRLSSVLDMDSVISQQSLREVQLVLFSVLCVLDRVGNSGERHDKEAF